MSKHQRSNLIQLGAKLNQLDNLTKGEAADLGAQLRLDQRISEPTDGSRTWCLAIFLITLVGLLLLFALF